MNSTLTVHSAPRDPRPGLNRIHTLLLVSCNLWQFRAVSSEIGAILGFMDIHFSPALS